MIPYKQLTFEQRYTIQSMLSQHIALPSIAQAIGCHLSTLYREIKRNSRPRGSYKASYAHRLALERRKEGHYKTIFDERMKKRVKQFIKKEWSPEQIVGFCRRNNIPMVSHERIYQYIWQDKAQGGRLYTHLRHGSKKYRKRYGCKDTRGRIKDKVSIDKRPDIINKKQRFGDWEVDLIEGKGHKGTVLVMVERKSSFLALAKTEGKKAASIKKQLINALAPYKQLVHSITNDNGKEFAYHKQVAQKLQAQVFFCHPYAAWQRGLNEYTNKLIRQYLPKKADLTKVTPNQLALIANKLNNRPRKKLDFRSPLQVFMNNFNP